jgi:hypothetical protein
MELPSQEAMVHYLFHLTHKYQELEQKMAKLQQSMFPYRRKTIQEILEQLPTPSSPFSQWWQSIEITDDVLEMLFKSDLKTGIKQILEPLLTDLTQIPIRAFSQKPNTFYLYDNEKWSQMTSEEFSKYIHNLEHKFLKKYMVWVNEHREELQATPQGEEKKVRYMAKVNGLKQPPRAPEIKKWLFAAFLFYVFMFFRF